MVANEQPANVPIDSRTLSKLRRIAPDDYVAVIVGLAEAAAAVNSPTFITAVLRLLEKEVEIAKSMSQWLEIAFAAGKLKFHEADASTLPFALDYLSRAKMSGTGRDIAKAYTLYGTVLCTLGKLHDGLDAFVEAKRLIRGYWLPENSILYQNMAVAYMEIGDYDEALILINELAERDGRAAPYFQGICHLNLATIGYETAAYDDAIYHANQTARLGDFFPKGEHGTALAILGLIALERADVGLAQELSAQARSAFLWGDPSYCAILHGRLLANSGRIDDAVAYLDTTVEETRRLYKPAMMRVLLERWRIKPLVSGDGPRIKAFAHEALLDGMMPIVSSCIRLIASSPK